MYFSGLDALTNNVDEQRQKADAIVASLANADVPADVKKTVEALATFLKVLTDSFAALTSLLGRRQMGKRDTASGGNHLSLGSIQLLHKRVRGGGQPRS